MKLQIRLAWKPMAFIAGWMVLAISVSGCRTTFRTVDERFMAQPAAHQRVQVLPIWFEGAGNIDRSLSTNDLQVFRSQTGKNLVHIIRRELQSKGYQVIEPVQLSQSDQRSSGMATELFEPLEAVRADLCKNLQQPFASSADGRPLTFQTNTTLGFFRSLATSNSERVRLEHNPFHYTMTSSPTNVLLQIGATNTEAVLLVDSKAFFESRHYRTKRTVWNWTGGGAIATAEVGLNLAIIAVAALSGSGGAMDPIWVDPFWYSSNSLQHNIALVDAHTSEVLWLNREDFRHQDPRDAEILANTVARTLADLPHLP